MRDQTIRGVVCGVDDVGAVACGPPLDLWQHDGEAKAPSLATLAREIAAASLTPW